MFALGRNAGAATFWFTSANSAVTRMRPGDSNPARRHTVPQSEWIRAWFEVFARTVLHTPRSYVSVWSRPMGQVERELLQLTWRH
jgi:hypothetical protein